MESAALIFKLGEVAARAANRAIEKGESAGSDQNRAQFVGLVMEALKEIPVEIRGDETKMFIETYKDGAYGAAARAAGRR